jgi:hypothetical protein
MLDYAGERKPPADVLQYRGWTGKQTENRFSHWIWRQYADCMWDDIRMHRVLPYKEARDSADDEKHVHPLQLDVIDRCVELFSNLARPSSRRSWASARRSTAPSCSAGAGSAWS